MHQAGARAERAGLLQHFGRGAVVGGQAGLVLGPLLGQVGVQRRGPVAGPGDDRPELIARDGAHRVDGGADHGRRLVRQARGQPAGPGRPGLRVAVAEAHLSAGQRQRAAVRAEAAGQVAGVQQADPQARPAAASIRVRPISLGSAYGVPPVSWCR